MIKPTRTSIGDAGDRGFALRFSRVDIESYLGLPCGRLTTPSLITSLLGAAVLMALVYGGAYGLRTSAPEFGAAAWLYLTAFEGVPIAIAFLSCWTVSILTLKALKIRAQRRALSVQFLPADPLWTLDSSSADELISAIARKVEEPEQFVYLRRTLGVLRTMRNVGRISDVEDLFQSRADTDESVVISGYTPVKAFIWGVPVLGFIGTVLGLTTATGQFGKVLADPEMRGSIDAMTTGLTKVLGGLDTAFVTTAEGLIAAFFLYMLQMLVRQADERLLDDIRDACSTRIVTHVRVIARKEVANAAQSTG